MIAAVVRHHTSHPMFSDSLLWAAAVFAVVFAVVATSTFPQPRHTSRSGMLRDLGALVYGTVVGAAAAVLVYLLA